MRPVLIAEVNAVQAGSDGEAFTGGLISAACNIGGELQTGGDKEVAWGFGLSAAGGPSSPTPQKDWLGTRAGL